MSEVQSVLIPKKFGESKAINWLDKNGFVLKKVDITKNYYRFRQRNPNKKSNYYTIKLKNGVRLVMY